MRAQEELVHGENGGTALKEVDPLLALDYSLVRGIQREKLLEMYKAAIKQNTIDVILLSFHTRWVRGGKGERRIFVELMVMLYKDYPKQITQILKWVPQYGTWKDLLLIAELQNEYAPKDADALHQAVYDLFGDQLRRDELEMLDKGKEAKISYAAKYAALEKTHFSRTIAADKGIAGAFLQVVSRVWHEGKIEK